MENVWTIDGKFLENALMPVMRGCWGCCPLSRANFAENVQPENLKVDGKWMDNGLD